MTDTTAVSRDRAVEELGKYLQLRISGAPMFSPYIDEVWHEMMQNDSSYQQFSLDTWGEVVEHKAFTPGDNVYYEIPWVPEYETRFGKLPDVWFAGTDGAIDEELRGRYRETGKVERLPPRSGPFMTCDCRPRHHARAPDY